MAWHEVVCEIIRLSYGDVARHIAFDASDLSGERTAQSQA
jgi:hypothetical protein